jgi:hypothetical protein
MVKIHMPSSTSAHSFCWEILDTRFSTLRFCMFKRPRWQLHGCMRFINHILLPVLALIWLVLPSNAPAQNGESITGQPGNWHLSLQYLGVTYHPNGGNTPEVYPLKLDDKAYLVLDVGVAANLDYSLNSSSFLRLTTALYKDCAFVTAGCAHAGPRLAFSWGGNSINAGIGPIFSFRRDWHRFGQYRDDEFYGNRVYRGWQYRFFPFAVEFEYLCRINESMQFQWSIIPGGDLIVTSLFGVRFRL